MPKMIKKRYSVPKIVDSLLLRAVILFFVGTGFEYMAYSSYTWSGGASVETCSSLISILEWVTAGGMLFGVSLMYAFNAQGLLQRKKHHRNT